MFYRIVPTVLLYACANAIMSLSVKPGRSVILVGRNSLMMSDAFLNQSAIVELSNMALLVFMLAIAVSLNSESLIFMFAVFIALSIHAPAPHDDRHVVDIVLSA